MVDKETKTPYLSQSDAGLTPGPDYGAPAAVTNSLVWLARHGYSNLLSAGADDYQTSAVKAMNQLATSGFMIPATRTNRGGPGGPGGPGGAVGGRPGAAGGGGKDTEPGNLMSGVRLFVEEHGYKTSTLAYQGWRKLPGSLDTAGDTPDISTLKKWIAMPSTVVWLNLGWYTQSSPGEFQRSGGQWVTLVGFGNEDQPQRDGASGPQPGERFAWFDYRREQPYRERGGAAPADHRKPERQRRKSPPLGSALLRRKGERVANTVVRRRFDPRRRRGYAVGSGEVA